MNVDGECVKVLEWHSDMYMDEVVAGEPERYKQLVEDDKLCIPTIYCVTLASNRDNLLDIISCNELMFAHYRRNRIPVVGLAASYKKAVNLVIDMVLDTYKTTGTYDVRKLFHGIEN